MFSTCDKHQQTSNHVCPCITGKKKRVRTHLEQRGGIPAKGNPGDKPYKKVDHCPGIQQAGESIVGSSFYRSVGTIMEEMLWSITLLSNGQHTYQIIPSCSDIKLGHLSPHRNATLPYEYMYVLLKVQIVRCYKKTPPQ